MIRELVTHDGRFHADEVMSTAILRDLFPEAVLIRSRDPALTAPAAGRIVFDVGGRYDHEDRIYDHHQPGAPVRDNDVAFSSFGLIWQHYGHDWLRLRGVPDTDIEKVHGRYDRSIVQPIDENDTGARSLDEAGFMRGLALPALIGDLLPDFDNDGPEALRDAFDEAVGLAGMAIRNRVRVISAKLRAESEVRAAVIRAGDGQILELPRGMPYNSVLESMKADHLLYMISPSGDRWQLAAIKDGSEGRSMRKPLPEEWAGLRDEGLSAATGVPDAVFAHAGLFLAVAGSRDGIMELARQALARVVEPELAEPTI